MTPGNRNPKHVWSPSHVATQSQERRCGQGQRRCVATCGQWTLRRQGHHLHWPPGGQWRWARRQGHHLTWPRVASIGGCGQGHHLTWPRVASIGGAGKRRRCAWPRVAGRGGANKGNGARGYVWSGEAARAKATARVATRGHERRRGQGQQIIFTRGHAWPHLCFLRGHVWLEIIQEATPHVATPVSCPRRLW